MPREARLFESAKGSPSRALFKLSGNIPPNWIARARASRKTLEPDLAASMRKLLRLRKTRQLAYEKESFYNGLRTLLEINREGESKR
jgi:hypothetical protein